MKNSQERRAERLRPEQLRLLRDEAPVAYLPLGVLEWHGPHNPLGLDGVKAHSLCLRAAERTGGVVFPTMFWGPAHGSNHHDVTHPQPAYFDAYGVPADNFAGKRFPMGPALAQWELFCRVLDQALRVIGRYGFKSIVVYTGHGPLAACGAVTALFHQETGIHVWAGHEGRFTGEGTDHGAKIETALMGTLEPETVDWENLPKPGEPEPPGVVGKPVAEVTHEYGEQLVEKVVAGLVELVTKLRERQVY